MFQSAAPEFGSMVCETSLQVAQLIVLLLDFREQAFLTQTRTTAGKTLCRSLGFGAVVSAMTSP